MLALQPIDTVPHAFRPDPVTQEEAAAMFRAVLNLFGKCRFGLTGGGRLRVRAVSRAMVRRGSPT